MNENQQPENAEAAQAAEPPPSAPIAPSPRRRGFSPLPLALLAIGLALLIGGLFVGLSSVSVQGLGCGRPLSYSLDVADENAAAVIAGIEFDSNAEAANFNVDALRRQAFRFIAECDEKLGQRRLISWPLTIGGVLIMLAGAVSVAQRRPTTPGQAN